MKLFSMPAFALCLTLAPRAQRTNHNRCALWTCSTERTPPTVFVLGGPGSGKGTQCTRLVRDMGFAHITVGELLRKEAASGTDEGRLVSRIMQAGNIVPSAITMRLLRNAVEDACAMEAPAVLIDGFPRNMEQAREFERIMFAPRYVLYFSCSSDEMRRRILSRAPVSGRADDDDQIITRRLETYKSKTMPVIRHFHSRGLLREVDAGIGGPDEVYVMTRAMVELENTRAMDEATVSEAS